MPALDPTRPHTKPAFPPSLQVAGKPPPRKMPYELNEYRDQHSSITMLGALFRDIYTTGRPSSALGVLLSSYAMLRLGANSDMTNAVPIVHMGDEDYQWPADASGRGRRYRPPYGAQDGSAPNLAWIRALAWEPRVTKMISLAPGSLGFIADPNQTVEFILALAQEWSGYSSVNFPRTAELRAYYLRTATDVIFRLTIHGAQTFSSRPSAEAEGHAQRYGANRRGVPGNPQMQMQQQPASYLPDNALHLVSIWDEGKQKWLLSGLFLCPYGYAVSPSTWSMTPKDADLKYSQFQAHRIPSEKRINVDPLPDIVISGPTIQEPSPPAKGSGPDAAGAAATAPATKAASAAGTAGTAYNSIAEHETHGPQVQGLGLLPAMESDGDDELSGLDVTSAASESDDDPEDDDKTESDSTEELEQPPAEEWDEMSKDGQSMESSPAIDISRAISPSRLVQMQNLGYDDSLGPQRSPFGTGSYHMDVPVPNQPASASNLPVNGPVLGPGPVLANLSEMPDAPSDIPSRLTTPYSTDVSRPVTPLWPGAFPRSNDSSASFAVPTSTALPAASSGSSLRPWLWPFGGAKTAVIAGEMPVTPPPKTPHSGITEIFKTPQVPPPSKSVKADRESTVVISPVTIDPPQTRFNAPATAAVREHLSSSVLALSKLAKAQGMNLTEFMSMVLDTAEVAFKAS